MSNVKKYRILSIEAERLVHSQSVGGFSALRGGNPDIGLFSGIFDYSLESEKLREVWEGTRKMSRKTYFTSGGYDYTTAVINVKFNYKRCDFVGVGGAFVRDGYKVSEAFFDSAEVADIESGKLLVAIKTHCTLEYPPLSEEILGEYFTYDAENNFYVRRRDENNKKVAFKEEEKKLSLREKLYSGGFDVDGVHYVRYKRSAGSSRSGQCLFIAEPLYKKMMEWSLCGLDLKNRDDIDLASFEAYVSLSLSSITDTLRIPLDSILFMRDAKSTFSTRSVSVECDGEGILSSEEKELCVTNVIWDGEALLDESVFRESGYAGRGMMLLRNRFFKTCAFNTNLRKYFADKGITDVSQLCGYTRASSIDDVKLIVTESSLKYLKLSGKRGFEKKVEAWMSNVDDLFGIVKTDKPTGFFGGRVVRTSYQLLNTLGLSRDEVKELLADTFDYYEKVRSSPVYMRNYINYTLGEDDDEGGGDTEFFNARQKAILGCLSRNDRFAETLAYKEFRSSVLSSFSKKIRSGRLLIKGTNATIFGNGLELLSAAVGEFQEGNGALALCGEGKIYCKHFDAGATLLGCRSPHVTMGNLMVAENISVPEIDKYFNLTGEIVYVNAIECNVQQRLNGCDYDSDAMLLTDNPLMVAAGMRNRGFAVPVCSIASTRKEYADTPVGKAALDYEISGNKIGEIINLSQQLNTLYWHTAVNSPEARAKNEQLYKDICVLAVLSGMEIDKAKRNYDVATASVLARLKSKYSIEKRPEFFKFIMNTLEKRKYSGEVLSYDTTMDYVFSETMGFTKGLSKNRMKNLPLSFFIERAVEKGEVIKSGSNDARDCEAIKVFVRRMFLKIGELRVGMNNLDADEKYLRREEMELVYREAVEYVSKKLKNSHMLKLLLRDLDEGFSASDENKKLYWILFETLCLENGGSLGRILSKARDGAMSELVPDERGKIEIYGIRHAEKVHKNEQI